MKATAPIFVRMTAAPVPFFCHLAQTPPTTLRGKQSQKTQLEAVSELL
jgi:hypothetical protein